jgi:hypothetical protein
MHAFDPVCVRALVLLASLAPAFARPIAAVDRDLHVDPVRGDDSAEGTKERPLRSISAAIAKLPDPLDRSASISLSPGIYTSTGGVAMSERSLELVRRMRPGVSVEICGVETDGKPTVLAWKSEIMVDAREGAWKLRRLVIGTEEPGQKRGIQASGPVEVLAQDVSFRLRSNSDAGVMSRRGARVALRGTIRLNDPPPDGESFSGIVATDSGVVEFDERQGSFLELGNGSLAASYYGSIRLGCEAASITSRTRSNCLSIGNSGRIDLRNTPTLLVATDPKNTPIGLEHDGHVLAEDAKITIVGTNDAAIALQKSSTLTCNDVELKGKFDRALWASSGSIFVGAFVGDVGRIEATTGASIHIEKVGGKVIGPIEARHGGIVSLPDRVVTSR